MMYSLVLATTPSTQHTPSTQLTIFYGIRGALCTPHATPYGKGSEYNLVPSKLAPMGMRELHVVVAIDNCTLCACCSTTYYGHTHTMLSMAIHT